MKKTAKSKPANHSKKTKTKIEVYGYAVEIQVREITAEMADELTVTGVSSARCSEIVDDSNHLETFAYGMDAGWLVVDGEIMEDLLPAGNGPKLTDGRRLSPTNIAWSSPTCGKGPCSR
jgi:hypothetical protein